ncbi:MAG: serine/threonine-protein kinase [Chitinivibrionales bacterium]
MQNQTNIGDPDWLPEFIGPYKVLQIIGMGGMGVIYKALQQPLNRVVALKVLPPQFCNNEEVARRFEIEAKAISLLQHQNIVNIYEYGNEDGFRYFAMQFVDGNNLSAVIHHKKIMPIHDVIDFSKQICRALRYAHAQNVIHRDIKPHNILIDKENVVRLTDFGIAKIFSMDNITMTGVTVGTPEYMSPEQAEGNQVDAQTDIYSLGVVMYEMLAKKPPFTANNPIAIAYKHVHEMPVPPSVRRRDTPKRLELIVLKALKKKKADRYESVAEMLEHLDSVDLDEFVERPTVSFSTKPLSIQPEPENKNVFDKRITDRREAQRRNLQKPFKNLIFDKDYWIDLFAQQWLSLSLCAVLAIILFIHLFSHK